MSPNVEGKIDIQTRGLLNPSRHDQERHMTYYSQDVKEQGKETALKVVRKNPSSQKQKCQTSTRFLVSNRPNQGSKG